jgi:hypothetical protein
MSSEISERIGKFNEIAGEARRLLLITRGSELQQAMVDRLSTFLEALANWKSEAVAQQDEGLANLFLGLECIVEALIAELNMWVMLKNDKPDDAWSKLIAAQGSITHALRAHDGFAGLENEARRLEAIEKIIFPPQTFFSAGLIVSKSICSICDLDYEDCPHIVGKAYWGEFCFRRLKDFEPNHIAIVENPASKECRATHISVEGGKRNQMTWRVEPSTSVDKSTEQKGGLLVSGIIMKTTDLVS